MAGSSAVEVRDLAHFESLVSERGATVVHFWAKWCEPCAQMDQVMDVLCQEPWWMAGKASGSANAYLRVEAESEPCGDIVERFEVAEVPHFVILKGGRTVATVRGADVPELNAQVLKHAQVESASVVDASNDAEALNRRLAALVSKEPVMLFMKGHPDEPRCGFSRKAVDAMRASGCTSFGHFDILSDETVRQGLKVFSDWPTFPQLYVRGELLGGWDIMREMKESGELADALAGATEASPAAPSDPTDPFAMKGGSDERLAALVKASKVMLFMKGDADEPRCGFSAKVVKALRESGVAFKTFDILQDQDVRQNLKVFSDWPTYPQLYVDGELVGGCDIILDMHESGELAKVASGA